MDIYIIIGLCFLHFVSDFVLQTDEMAKNKSSCNKALTLHVAIYSIPFMILINPVYGLVNGIIHWYVDFVSSRVSSKLYKKGDIHNFFVVIGFDQFIHIATLIITYWVMFIK